MTYEEVLSVVKHLAVEIMELELDPESLGDEDNLVRQLNMDSIASIELLIELETKFDIEFADEELTMNLIGSPSSLARLVTKKRIGSSNE